jgi:hypothetical protein
MLLKFPTSIADFMVNQSYSHEGSSSYGLGGQFTEKSYLGTLENSKFTELTWWPFGTPR